jgi:UDP-N-acetylmuramate dehydrogenase
MIKLIKMLNSNKIYYKEKVSLEKLSYLKSKGLVDLVIFPTSIEELKTVNTLFKNKNLRYKIVGNTSNILFLDDIVYSVFLSTKLFNKYNMDLDNNVLQCQSGLMLPKIVRKLVKNNITGFEGLAGIPGTVGASVFMNAGAYGNEISDNIISVDLLNSNNEIITYKKDELNFRYRNSIFKNNYLGIIVNVTFDISKKDKQKNIMKRLLEFKHNRTIYQEYKKPNLGSLFATKDIYSDIGRHNIFYGLLLKVVRKIIHKILKPKDNMIINFFTCKFFGLSFKNQPFSDKTMNCIINIDDIKETLRYIEKIKQLTNNELKLENEIYEGKE